MYRCYKRRHSKAKSRLEISNVTPSSTPSSNGRSLKDEPLDVEEKTIDHTDQAVFRSNQAGFRSDQPVFQSTAYCKH